MRRLSAVGLSMWLLVGPGTPAVAKQAAAPAPAEPALDLAQWEEAIQAFEAADREHPPGTGGILFAGSSSIRMWTTLQDDFAGMNVLNRGFGGSQIREVTAFAPRIVLPYRPRLIVFYCGTNDVTGGRAPADVAADFREFVRVVRRELPHTRIAFISAAPNPARWHLRAQLQDLNERVRSWARSVDRVDYIDVWQAMLGPDGQPKPDIFLDDRLHMNAKGYAIWTRIVGEYLRRVDPVQGVQ